MADVETPAAEPSPAAPPAATPESPADQADIRSAVESMSVPTDPKAYAEWRQTGKLPETKPSKDDSAPSRITRKSAGDEPEKAAPASEAGNRRQERSNAETRKEELNREIRELLSKRDELRKEVEPAGKKDVKAEPSPAPEEPEGLKRPVKPKQEDYDDWDKFEAAQDKYHEDLADWKAAQRIEEHQQRQRQETATREMQARLDEAKQRYGAEAEPKIIDTAKAVFNEKAVPAAIKTAVGRSEVLVDALYVMGSDPDELSGFMELAKTDPLEALRKWFTVEALVKQELGKQTGSPVKAAIPAAPPRGADGKFLPPEKPARTKEATSPPVELNGNSSPPGDERERAVQTGNFRAFKADADRRDMLRFKGSG